MRTPLVLLMLSALLLAAAARAAPPAEPLAIVVAADATALTIDAETLSLIFKRKKQLWPDGRRILPVNLPADHALRQRFSRAVLQLSPAALEDYWNEQYFHGVTPPHVVASETAVARFVAETRGAIGYLSPCRVDAHLRVLLLIDAEGRPQPPTETPLCSSGSADIP